MPDSAPLAQPLLDALLPPLHAHDLQIAALRNSQSELHATLQRLLAELEILQSACEVPEQTNRDLENGLKKLDLLKTRVVKLNKRLADVDKRLDKVLNTLAAAR